LVDGQSAVADRLGATAGRMCRGACATSNKTSTPLISSIEAPPPPSSPLGGSCLPGAF
jgi:hypothetical protein